MATKTIQVADKKTLDRIAQALGVGENKIYGIKIDKNNSNPATRCTYLMDAEGMTPAKMNFTTGEFEYGDWKDVWFVKDNFPCMLKLNGAVDYKLNPDDYTKKEDGTASDVANPAYEGNAMSAMPLVWLRQYESGNYKYIYIANYKVNDDYYAYAHTDKNGDVHNYIFMSIYRGALYPTEKPNKLRSISGLQPCASKAPQEEIDFAKANGTDWFIKTWVQRNLMQSLLTMLFCNTNSQAILGNGNLNHNQTVLPSHGVLQTGTLNNKGQFYGLNNNTTQVKAFHQEAVWGDQWDRIVGLVNDHGQIKAKTSAPYLNVSNLLDVKGQEDYEMIGKTLQGTTGGYISETIMTKYGNIPYKASGSASTYETDGLWFKNDQINCALVGGNCASSSSAGLFGLALDNFVWVSDWSIGASLSYMRASI